LGFEVGVEYSKVLLSFSDSRGLLVFGGYLSTRQISVSRVQLDQERVKVLLGELLVEGCDFGSSGQLGGGMTFFQSAVEKLVADRVGFMLGVGCVGVRSPSPGAMNSVDEGKSNLNTRCEVVLLEAEVVVLKVIELREATVLSVEGDLRPEDVAILSEGRFTFGPGNRVGGFDSWAGD
jgi:hypothetical protein